ncbi:MAG: inorganic phosphate transporter, partial [Candidatus Methanomethylicaceae archaeon]
MDVQLILLIAGLILAFIMAMNLGGNDAANPTSAVIGAGVLSLKKALLFFAIFTTLGAALQGHMVMKTIGRGIVPSIDVVGAFAIILAANIWIFIATIRGMAISTTHSIISAVIGYG